MTLKLKDPELLRYRAFIDGEWVEGDSGESFPVFNPAAWKLPVFFK